MLDNHLLYKVNGKAFPDNYIFYKNYRITLLSDSLFRVEQNQERVFNDLPTQMVINRNLGPVPYAIEEMDDCLKIKTPKITIIMRETLESSRVIIDVQELEISNVGNLKGTFSTLDRFDGKYFIFGETGNFIKDQNPIPLCDGVCSKNGIAVLDDSNTLSFNEDGKICETKALGIDWYVFAFGDNYREAVKQFFDISGKSPIIPRFALGNWWSRYYEYNEEDYYGVLNKFERRDIPITVAVIDMDWHYSIEDEIANTFSISESMLEDESIVGGNARFGWTGYTWNKRLFPDYQRFLAKIKEKGYKITLNIHPADGIRFWEDSYPEMAKVMGINPETKEYIPFDITNDTFVNNYFSVLHKPYEDLGVDFWWIDWQQGDHSNIKGLTPLWALNHYHYLDIAKNHTAPLILSRFAGAGSQRYPLGFSGDTFITWETLDFLPEFVATASNIGYGWWSNDIGGHMHGYNDIELYTRMIQYGVFSPINRLHSCNFDTLTKEPWFYKNGTGLIASEFLRLRHQLIPHLYSTSVRVHRDGSNIVEPIYYYVKNEKAYEYKNEYFFCDNMLVAPITSKKESDNIYSKVDALIPRGKWTDFFTNEEYDVKEELVELTLSRSLDTIPVLVKEGSIVPLSLDKGNKCDNPENLLIKVYEGDGTYELIEDDRNNNGENTLITNIRLSKECSDLSIISTLEIFSCGSVDVIPQNRTLEFEFINVCDGECTLLENGNEMEYEVVYNEFKTIKFAYNPLSKYTIILKHKETSKLDILKKQLEIVVLELEDDNNKKHVIYNEIKKSNSIDEFIDKLDTSDLPLEIKNKIKEICTF